jgi:hypothetical protein
MLTMSTDNGQVIYMAWFAYKTKLMFFMYPHKKENFRTPSFRESSL